MSPNDSFRPALSLSSEQATAFLSLASHHVPGPSSSTPPATWA